MSPRLRRLASLAAVAPEERMLAGSASGVLYMVGGITLASFVVLPGITRAHLLAILAIASVATSWGTCSIRLIDWDRAPIWLIHLSASVSFGLVAGAVASS